MNKPIKTKKDMIANASFHRAPIFSSEVAEENALLNAAERIERAPALSSNPPQVRLELTV
jgi:hypothetical protein